jgi:dTDP-glucose 4,6-dehydratase
VTRVLLTGASGFVGSHVLDALVQLDCHVVVISSFTCNGTLDRITDVVERHPDAGVTLVRHDLTAPLSTRQRQQVGDVDWVIDVASRSSVDESLQDPACFILNNVGLTLTTLELARELRPELYVHLSTDEVYGPEPASSLTDHRPSSPYAASKAAQEDVCHAYARTYGLPITVATSANMFGPRQSTLAFVPKIVRAALRDEPITVHVRGGQPGIRRYNHVGDVAHNLVGRMFDERLEPRLTYPGRYVIDNATLAEAVWELTVELANLTDREPRLRLVNVGDVRPGYDPWYATLRELDETWLSRAELADAPLDERLFTTVEWFVTHPEWLE